MDANIGKTNQEMALELGEQIKSARLQLNLSQEALAQQANISRRAVQALEGGAGSSLDTLIAVCRSIGKTDWIYAFAPVPRVNPMIVVQIKARAEKMTRKRAGKSVTP